MVGMNHWGYSPGLGALGMDPSQAQFVQQLQFVAVLQAFLQYLAQIQPQSQPGCSHDHGGGHPDLQRGYAVPTAPTEQQRSSRPSGTVRANDYQQADAHRRANGTQPAGSARLAPEAMNEREKYDYYANIVRQNGGQVCANGEATVLGIRGQSSDGVVHDTASARRYDDMFVVLRPDGTVREIRGATHPGQNNSTQSPDVTGDGAGDVGMINTGNYRVVPNGAHGGAASYRVKTADGGHRLSGVRDTNHDGQFSASENSASEQRGDFLAGVLFHQGNSNAPSSIGCQTMSPREYQEFISAVGGSRASFNYTLVDAYRG